jgi:hypothetical protein
MVDILPLNPCANVSRTGILNNYQHNPADTTQAKLALKGSPGFSSGWRQGSRASSMTRDLPSILRVMARLTDYSPTNVVLILLHRPEATNVARYRTWQSLGRQVKKGETGIKILVPFRR